MAQEDKGTDTMAHQAGVAKGEEQSENQGKEAGHHDTNEDDSGRPSGTRTARSATSINPEDREPIDDDMPNMPPA